MVSRVNEASKLVDGLEIIEKDTMRHCKDYILANMKRHPFDDEVVTKKVPLRRTNIDILGPSRITSEGGAIYAMKFHDSRTSH
jgi:hypothetical protein